MRLIVCLVGIIAAFCAAAGGAEEPAKAAGPGDASAKAQVRPVMELHLLAPAYRGQVARFTEGKPLSGWVSIDRAGHGLEGKPLTLEWRLMHGEEPLSTQRMQIGAGETSYQWQSTLPELPAGRYELRTRLLDEQGNVVGEDAEGVEVLQPLEQRERVWIDDKGRTMVEGKPFFPFGLYLGPTEDEHLARIAAAGFNTILCYGYGQGADPKAYMDRAQKHGLRVIYSVKDFYEGTKWTPPQGKTGLDVAREYVTMVRDHPALLAWYINDELEAKWIPRLKEMYELVMELDPKHPAFQVLCKPEEFGAYYRVTDVLGVDPYPVPRHPLDMVGDWVDAGVKAVQERKPVWVVPQLHKWAIYSGEDKDREPTYEEKRCMAYLGIIHGARGMIFYSYFDLSREKNRSQAPPEVFEKRWEEVTRIAGEIKSLIPIVLNGTSIASVVSKPGVHANMIRVGGDVYIIAANASSAKPSDFVLGVPERTKPEAADVLTDKKVAIEGGVLREQFQPLEVKVYKIEKER